MTGRAAARSAGIVLMCGLQLTGCTVAPPSEPTPALATFTEEGLASWYRAAHQGRPTASGERYDAAGLTAAHRSLPLNTIARVTRRESGTSVKVRINDRGPHARGRVIDLSAQAA